MNELLRLEAVEKYQILDTLPEKEFDDIAELAAFICDTPVSFITIIGANKVWHKARFGIDVPEVPREYSFCVHMMPNPTQQMVISDLTQDERFIANPLVVQDPNVRFYGGFPLVTDDGYLLGSLCVLDARPRELTEVQQRSLTLLAIRVMQTLNARKEIIENKQQKQQTEEVLYKLTNTAPGAFYQFEISPDGTVTLPFVSKRIEDIFKGYSADTFKNDYRAGFELIHHEDLLPLRNSIRYSCKHLTTWNAEFRILCKDKGVRWYQATAQPERHSDNTVILYGTVHEITEAKEYTQAIEEQYHKLKEIAWIQSHVVRAPLARIKGLAELLADDDNDMSTGEIYENIIQSSNELDLIIKDIVDKTNTLKN